MVKGSDSSIDNIYLENALNAYQGDEFLMAFSSIKRLFLVDFFMFTLKFVAALTIKLLFNTFWTVFMFWVLICMIGPESFPVVLQIYAFFEGIKPLHVPNYSTLRLIKQMRFACFFMVSVIWAGGFIYGACIFTSTSESGSSIAVKYAEEGEVFLAFFGI